VLGEMLPDVDRPVLEIFVNPEQRLVGGIVAVEVSVLASWQRVEVDDAVDAISRALWPDKYCSRG
jgi:hypothetical protein